MKIFLSVALKSRKNYLLLVDGYTIREALEKIDAPMSDIDTINGEKVR